MLEAVVSGRRLIGGNLMIESAVPLGAGLLAKLALACQKAENALRWHALRRPKSESTRGHGGRHLPIPASIIAVHNSLYAAILF